MRMTSVYKSTDVVDLNVGGVHYTTTVATLTRCPGSRLYRMFNPSSTISENNSSFEAELIIFHKDRVHIDRDGILFRFILDYLRSGNNELTLPESFQETERLYMEAEYFQLPDLAKHLLNINSRRSPNSLADRRSLKQESTASINGISTDISPVKFSRSNGNSGGEESSTITIGYRGTFAFGRGDGAGASDVKFRKLLRILVAGKVSVCREVFRDTLNESRDPDRGDNDRYTSRFFLKHSFLEQAFDMLHETGFRMVAAVASGTNGSACSDAKAIGADSEETRWLHYNEFVFTRP